ncbi:DUF423 domain-containing protein [Jiella pacifica]|uniref:DUF423 domain-containing protein n=1 Tax=Jiella pacifica TaxID=2696469 RepID=A0A6N9SXF8_9HYPH|nr:DUF423 domain-containing protein [Jiella pacifica]NDW03767.1 DUF423 domain-containing protein [Jiella pacifica]
MSASGIRVLCGLFIVFAGLFGAAGVAGAALAAHVAEGDRFVAIAASMALIHAPALLGVAAVLPRTPRLLGLAGAAMMVGVVLFSGDLAMRAATGASLFANAAPTGGTMLIAGWLLTAVAGVVAMFRRQETGVRSSAPRIDGVTR